MSDARQVVPHDDEAEAVLLGGALVWPHALEAVAGDLEAGDFYAPTHGRIWQAIADLLEEGSKPEVVLVADRVRRAGATIETARLAELMAGAVMPRRPVVELILRHSAARKLLGVLGEARQEIADGGDAFEVAQRGSADLDRVAAGASSDKPEALTMPELCDSADAVAPWVIRGLFRRDWRAVIVAPEGVGKSVLLRQLAVCAAQGVHPLRFERIPAVRTLIVDCENPLDSIRETGGPLDAAVHERVGAEYDAGRCRTWSRPGGIDLRDARDRASLVREISAQRPELVCMGPIYKLGGRRERESYEEAADGILRVLDQLRMRFNFALAIEGHAPKAQGGVRQLAPFGSQRWLAWPELGLGLQPRRDGTGLQLTRFRGDRLRCMWPDRLVRGRTFPFEGVWEHNRERTAQ